MPGTLTKTDVRFDGLRLGRELQEDGTYRWFVTVGYRVVTVEGEEYVKDREITLSPSQTTAAKNFLQALYTQIKAEEGIV